RQGMVGLVYFEDRSDPLPCRVTWTAIQDGLHRAGLKFLRASELLTEQARPGPPRKALVILTTPEAKTAATRVLKSMRTVVHMFDGESSALDEDALAADITLISESVFETEIGRRLMESRRPHGVDRLIVINENLDRAGAIEMISSRRFEHLIPSRTSSEEA